MLMPPPNANANLHLGHALTVAIEDTVARYRRMRGDAVLYLPGADHAGFETQVVFERKLEAEGMSRFDFERQELYSRIYDFVKENRGNMESQVRSLGASCDWSRNTFTLDDSVVAGTHRLFKQLWDDGLVYRSQRIVNYCTHHDTSFSDLEVEYEERTDKLYRLQYPLESGAGAIEVATTRPETMLGDTAVAVHPEDERCQAYIGESARVPLAERPVPIVADDGVDPEFGSGAVKVTPAHDQLDFEIGQRHHLPLISVIDTGGHISEEAPTAYQGMDVDTARKQIVKDLKANGYLLEEKKFTHSVGVCYKCGSVIEPLVQDQWLINVRPLADEAIEALDEGRVQIYPESKRGVLRDWYQRMRDWNISRQIAWGIPIPAFVNAHDSHDWIYDERVSEEAIEVDGKTYYRDPDVFDTWFSSGQWPLHTLGYPDGEDFQRFYPTALMETGNDILFWWVSRMLMLGLYATGEVPFREVYLHGLVLDEQGQKMSKSKGNVIAPTDLQQEYGTDGMRAGLISGRSAGQNQGLDRSKLAAGRNTANKLWNIARYILDVTGEEYTPAEANPTNLTDRWLQSRLYTATDEATQHLDNYRLSQAWDSVYEALWSDFADWYLEASKAEPNHDMLVWGLETILRLAHPFLPFVTEAIWQQLPWRDDLLISTEWPAAQAVDREALEQFGELQTVISQIRHLVQQLDLRQTVLYHSGEDVLEEQQQLLTHLAPIVGCEAVSDGHGLPIPGTKLRCWLGVDEDTLNQYRQQLREELQQLQDYIDRQNAKLANTGFKRNAPKEVVKDTKQRLQDAQARSQTLSEQIENLNT